MEGLNVDIFLAIVISRIYSKWPRFLVRTRCPQWSVCVSDFVFSQFELFFVWCLDFLHSVPAHIPPEVSTKIKHVFHVPPQFYPFLKKLGDDTPALRPYMEKLIKGELTFEDYEDMFYRFAKPAKIYRRQIPEPYRTPEEIEREQEVAWEGAWLSYRQRVLSGELIGLTGVSSAFSLVAHALSVPPDLRRNARTIVEGETAILILLSFFLQLFDINGFFSAFVCLYRLPVKYVSARVPFWRVGGRFLRLSVAGPAPSIPH